MEESKTARREIAEKYGLNIRLVYRATNAHLDWARDQIKKGPDPTTVPDPDQTQASAQTDVDDTSADAS